MKGMLRLCLALILSASVAAQGCASAQDYPELESYVTDSAGVLTESDIYYIGGICQMLYEEKGAEMAVLVVNTTLPDGITLFTVKTFEENQLGQEGEDNGILIVVSTDESAWRIEVGYGLQGILTNSRTGMLALEFLEPYLNQSLYYEGLFEITWEIRQILLEEYDGEPAKDPYPISFIPLTFWQLVIVVVIIAALTVVTKGRIFFFLPYLIGRGGGKNWGGGRSGGGGAGGRWK